jgi:tetratricopeptide (TPR) repeat protein
LGRQKQAIELYKHVIQLKPDLADAYRNLAIIHLQRGERGLALEQYKALKLVNYERAKELFDVIYQDKILDVKRH